MIAGWSLPAEAWSCPAARTRCTAPIATIASPRVHRGEICFLADISRLLLPDKIRRHSLLGTGSRVTHYRRDTIVRQFVTIESGAPRLIVRSSSSTRPSAVTSNGVLVTDITGISANTRG